MSDTSSSDASTNTGPGSGRTATRRTPGTCPLDCPDACGLWIETGPGGGFRRLRGDRDHPYTRGFLCAKTSRYHELVLHGGRLTTPMRRRGGCLEPCTWEQAVGAVAERVSRTAGEQILPLSYAGNMGLVARRFPQRMMNALGAGSHDGGICCAAGEAGYRAVLGDLVGPDIEDAAAADALRAKTRSARCARRCPQAGFTHFAHHPIAVPEHPVARGTWHTPSFLSYLQKMACRDIGP